MTSRRMFLGAMTAGVGAAALGGRSAFAAANPLAPEVKSRLGAPIGLQLWSLRADAPKDLPGTLARLRALGIVHVESAGLYDQDAAAVRAAIEKAGLKCSGSHIGYDRWQKDAAAAAREAKALGARFATVAWIKGEKDFTPRGRAEGGGGLQRGRQGLCGRGREVLLPLPRLRVRARRPTARCGTPSRRTRTPSWSRSRSTSSGPRRAAPTPRRSSRPCPGACRCCT